jgi:hypothetical protein
VEELFSLFKARISELQTLFNQLQSTFSFVEAAIRTRVELLRGRLRHLKAVGRCTTSSENTALQNFDEQLDAVERVMASVENKAPVADGSRYPTGYGTGRTSKVFIT